MCMKTRTDEEIRRQVLARAHWTDAQIDGWLVSRPRPALLAEQQAIFVERLHDALYAFVTVLRMPALVRRLGGTPRRWVLDREG